MKLWVGVNTRRAAVRVREENIKKLGAAGDCSITWSQCRAEARQIGDRS